MTRPLVAGNWKMNHTGAEADGFAERLLQRIASGPDADILIVPPALLVERLARAFHGSAVAVGGQNMHFEAKGAFTGEVSAAQLLAAGATRVLVGHSERRHVFGETVEETNRKVRAALSAGLAPVLCVGETLPEREKNATAEVVLSQLRGGLEGVAPEETQTLVVAYEPVWAIGTGKTASPEQAQEVHALLREELVKMVGKDRGAKLLLLYGGSVKPDNAAGLLGKPDINGCLVGGASLDADSFADIIFGAL